MADPSTKLVSTTQKQSGTFKSKLGVVLSCVGCMVGTGNIWRFPRIVANNSGDKGCLQFLLVWVVFLFIWSIPMVLIEYGAGRFTKLSTIMSFRRLVGLKSSWCGAWVALVVLGIAAYYSVVLGWCFYFLFYYLANDLPDTYEESSKIFNDFALHSDWPVLFHFLAISFAALSIAWGVKSIELVNTATVPIFLGLILFTFIWSLTLDQAAEGIKFLFTPDWGELKEARLWVDAISQNAFDTGAASGLFMSYAAYMTAEHGIVKLGALIPMGNNFVRYYILEWLIIMPVMDPGCGGTRRNKEGPRGIHWETRMNQWPSTGEQEGTRENQETPTCLNTHRKFEF